MGAAEQQGTGAEKRGGGGGGEVEARGGGGGGARTLSTVDRALPSLSDCLWTLCGP